MSGDTFGFSVEQAWDDGDGDEGFYNRYYPDARPVDKWKVELPHQCGGWTIAGPGEYGSTPAPDHAEAVDALEAFIAEAQGALVALKERREMAVDE